MAFRLYKSKFRLYEFSCIALAGRKYKNFLYLLVICNLYSNKEP